MKTTLLIAFLSMVSSFSTAADFCVAHWDNSFQFKEEFGVFLTSNCEGKTISSDKLFMKLTSGRSQRLEQQMTSRMSEIGYSPVARLGQLALFEKDAQGSKDTCAIELSSKFRPSLTCSNQAVNTRIYLDDLEMYKVYLTRLGYNYISEITSEVGSVQKQLLIFQK